MNLFQQFNQKFGFTQTESKVVLFLVIAFVVGIGAKTFRSSLSSPPSYDYAASDSEFAARSRLVDGKNSTVTDSDPARAPEEASISIPQRKVDINKASKEELIGLPGIGDAMAQRILLYREQHGFFNSVDELGNVKGIGKKKLDRLLPLCTAGK